MQFIAISVALCGRVYSFVSGAILNLWLYLRIINRESLCLFLCALLQLEPEQIRLGAADHARSIAVLCVEGLAAFVEGVDEVLASILVEAILLKAVWIMRPVLA